MIAMVDHNDLDSAEQELGEDVEQLLTPLTRYRPVRPNQPFAIDNGGYSEFRRKEFLSLLEREKPRIDLCRFVAVPDVVGSARRTLEAFTYWQKRIYRWPLALVAQDGQENLPIPWRQIEAIFIGGMTEWKMSDHVEHIIKCAQLQDKWVHVGRVNTAARWKHFEDLGADSIDGSGLARYTHMRKAIYERDREPPLFRNADQ